MGNASDASNLKMAICRLEAPRDVKDTIVRYFSNGFVLDNVNPREEAPNGMELLLHAAYTADFYANSKLIGNIGLTDKPNIRILTNNENIVLQNNGIRLAIQRDNPSLFYFSASFYQTVLNKDVKIQKS
jgi:hypothetical protein